MVLNPISDTDKVCVPLLTPYGYRSILDIDVVDRHYSLVGLLVAFLLCKFAWCILVPGILVPGEGVFRSVLAQELPGPVSEIDGVFSYRDLPSTSFG